MTVAPLPRPRSARLGTAAMRVRQAPTQRDLVSRRRAVMWSKRLLPVVALLLLTLVAVWPDLAREFGNGINFRRGGFSGELQAGKLLQVRYHGVDARNRPYTVTASQAAQVGPERINLVDPKGDVVSENGSWTYAESKNGVYIQHVGLLDLSGDVVLYRDNGITLRTQSISMDLKAGAAAGNEATHAEGPFGTLDSQGFALVDKGNVIQFDGKSRLILNGSQK
jgi:lipopolysaccharide export system protein LptC